ncbi:TIGR02679 family protein [Kibdelosporangium philippinense]|uniref:TIGR02679 family protein n=1 Tax=Kibdelosporangium philippinense TaxID=211113 RepID=A0ABS8ZHR3_9PSEU|nr:TIGR02679 family protein [Kibdelosporangium philippinense]MCE7007042.1 TIGR02679 family protein [Kibdelosporangium philippinense]
MADLDRLRRLLSGEDTAWLLDRMRRRLANGKPLSGVVTLTSVTQDQRRAVERLLGRRAGTGTSLTVSLDELDTVLRRSGAAPDGLVDAVRLLIGAVPERAVEVAAWSAVYVPLDELVARRPVLGVWRTWLDATGMVRKLAPDPETASTLIMSVVQVLAKLPSDGVGLGRLAAQTTGDAHGLDDGRPLTTLVLSAARVLAGSPPTGDGSAAERRAAWAAVGVHRDELSSSVLCLGLPGGTGTVTGRMLSLAREGGEPCVLTLRQLGQIDLEVGRGLVWVCENPSVLAAAADELGPECPPMVCVNGQPSAAVWRLLDLLAADGAQLMYHGDFDWGGLRIGNALRERIPWQPWRFDAAAYQAADVTGGELTGRPVDATWDRDLRPALERRGVRVEEELVLPALINDLRTNVS